MDPSEIVTTDNAPAVPDAPAATDNPLNNFAANNQPVPNPLNAAANPPAAPDATDPLAWLPEKFRTNAAEGGSLDIEASARKLAESYAHLEKRNGSGELAPADVNGYKLTLEGMNIDEMKKYPDFNEFLNKAHASGVNNSQLNLMVGEIINQAQLNKAEAEGSRMTGQQAEAALRQEWTTPDQYNQNMAAAVAAVRAVIPQGEQQSFFNDYGTDPRVLKLLAKFGAEVGEDRMALFGQPQVTEQDVDSLMKNPAYRDDKHPDHKAVRAKVSQYFQATAGSQRVV